MDCPIKTQGNTDWLLDYAAGRLRDERNGLLARHMETCGDCAGFVRAQQAVWNALDQWDPEAVSMDFDRRLYRSIEEARPSSGLPRMLRRLFRPLQPLWRPVLPLAAACLLIVAGVVLRPPPRVTPPPSAPRAGEIRRDPHASTPAQISIPRERCPAARPRAKPSM